MIDKYRLDDLRLESGEKGELARWVIQLQRDLDYERRKVSAPTAMAAKGSEPVADVVAWHKEGEERTCDIRWRRFDVAPGPLFAVAQPVAVDNTFIPKNLDRALGVVGVALPESKEEFNFQIERWMQRLIDRVIRYADEFKEKPAPVVPPAIEPEYEVIKSILPTANPDEYACCIGADMWNAFRAAMLQAGNSPAIPDGWQLVPKLVTQEISNAINVVGNRCTCGNCSQRLWDLLLAAAPQQEE